MKMWDEKLDEFIEDEVHECRECNCELTDVDIEQGSRLCQECEIEYAKLEM